MKTPFDAAMRVQRREIDAMGVAINAQANTLSRIECAQDDNRSKITRETEVAVADLTYSSHAYMESVRAERGRLVRESRLHSAQLDRLRDEATAAYGAFRAIEDAAETWRVEADRRSASAEQAGIDDRSAVTFLNARRALRRAAVQ